MSFIYCSKKEHEAIQQELASRFETAETIKGTQDNHALIPTIQNGEKMIMFERTSYSSEYQVQRIEKLKAKPKK